MIFNASFLKFLFPIARVVTPESADSDTGVRCWRGSDFIEKSGKLCRVLRSSNAVWRSLSSGALPGTGGRRNCGVGERPVTAGRRNFGVGVQSGVSGEQTCGVGERPVAAGHRNFNAGAQPVAGGERPVAAGSQPGEAKRGNFCRSVVQMD